MEMFLSKEDLLPRWPVLLERRDFEVYIEVTNWLHQGQRHGQLSCRGNRSRFQIFSLKNDMQLLKCPHSPLLLNFLSFEWGSLPCWYMFYFILCATVFFLGLTPACLRWFFLSLIYVIFVYLYFETLCIFRFIYNFDSACSCCFMFYFIWGIRVTAYQVNTKHVF